MTCKQIMVLLLLKLDLHLSSFLTVKPVIVHLSPPDPYRPTRQGVPAHIARGAPATFGTRVFYRGRTGRSTCYNV